MAGVWGRGYSTGMSELPAVRRYGEREVSRILERAAELQATEGAAAPSAGLTLGELEAIAAEVGLDPAHLRQAAIELDTGGADASVARLAGAPTRVRTERVLPFEVTTEALGAVVAVIQQTADLPGHGSLVGRSLTWQSQSASSVRTLQVMVTASGGRTLVRVEERYGGLAGGLFGGLVGGVGGGVGLGVGVGVGATLGSLVIGLGVPLVAFGGSYVLARTIFRQVVHGRRAALEALASRVMDALEPHSTR